MDTTINSTTSTTAVPSATPVANPVVQQPSPPTPPPSVPVMESGGSTATGGLRGFFNGINWIEVGFMILGSVALYYTIQYYRDKLKQDRQVRDEHQRQIDEIKMNVQTAMKGKYKSL